MCQNNYYSSIIPYVGTYQTSFQWSKTLVLSSANYVLYLDTKNQLVAHIGPNSILGIQFVHICTSTRYLVSSCCTQVSSLCTYAPQLDTQYLVRAHLVWAHMCTNLILGNELVHIWAPTRCLVIQLQLHSYAFILPYIVIYLKVHTQLHTYNYIFTYLYLHAQLYTYKYIHSYMLTYIINHSQFSSYIVMQLY